MSRPTKTLLGAHRTVTLLQVLTRNRDGTLVETNDERTTKNRVVIYRASCGRCSATTNRRKQVLKVGYACTTCGNFCQTDPPDPNQLTSETQLLISQALPSLDKRPNLVIFYLDDAKLIEVDAKNGQEALDRALAELTQEERSQWESNGYRYAVAYCKKLTYKDPNLEPHLEDAPNLEPVPHLAEATPPPPNRYDERILQYNEGYTENMTALATELALDPPPATWTTDGYLVSQWSMNVLKEDRQPLPKPHGWYKTFPTTPATSDARWLWMNNGDTTARDNALFDVSDLFDGFDEDENDPSFKERNFVLKERELALQKEKTLQP